MTTHFLRVILVAGLVATVASPAWGEAGDEPATETAAPAQWAVQPSGPDGPGNRDWFIYTLKPGAVFGDVVAISNLSDRPVRFVIYTADVEGVADVGGLAPRREDVAPTDVGAWIELATSERTVEPGTRIDVPFSLTVPEDAEPGDHVGAIIAVDADEGVVDPGDGDGTGFQIRQRIGARVYVRVDGPHEESLAVTRLAVDHDNPVFGGAEATVDFEIVNDGNLRLEPKGFVRITGFLGRTVKKMPLPAIPELLPGGNFVGSVTVDGLPPVERLKAELEVTGLGAETTRSRTFWPVPWLLLLLLVPLGWAARRWRQRRRSRGPEPTAPPPTAAPREPVGV